MIELLLVIGAGIFGVGVYGALSQQSFVMIMMGLELMLNSAVLVVITFWWGTTGGNPAGQLLVIVILAVMAIEGAIGFALVTAVYRSRKADITEKLKRLRN
ncbi:MAG: NADH-quinone oxidoreductase subunit NuoK [Acidimicrobiia bacterium]|nr:MAG: NADH-quinone oxidoreductase subunit NuoK [Acidimicrobiia bacterium]